VESRADGPHAVPDRGDVRLGAELRTHMRLAGPLCLSHIGQQLLSAVDAAMLGRYSDAALAGSGVAASLFFAVTVLGIGLVMGLDTLVPQALGAGEHGRARALYHRGVAIAVVAGLALTVVSIASLGLLDLAGANTEVREEARLYLLARAPSALPMLIATAARSYLQALAITRPIVIATIVGNLVNIVANGLLIYGDRALVALGLPAIGLPELGVVGAGLASSLVSLIMMLLVVAAARSASDARPTPLDRGTRTILALGIPVGLQLVLEVGVFATASALAARLGTLPAAAHQIALTLASFSFSIALGIGASTSVRVGHAVGRGDTHGARRAGLAGAILGGTMMGVFGVIFVSAPAALAHLFSEQVALTIAAIPLVRIAALFQLSDATQAVMAGALRGAGDARSTLLGNLGGHYLIGLPLMVLFAFPGRLGAAGLWWGLSAGLTAVAIALAIRFLALTSRPIARR